MMNLLELLYKQYKQLRDYIVVQWDEQNSIPLSNSEWNCLHAIVEGAKSVPSIMQRNEITKQAAHKVIKSLEEKEMVYTSLVKAPKLQRQIELTDFGRLIYAKSLEVHLQTEKKLRIVLGDEEYEQLIRTLNKKWL